MYKMLQISENITLHPPDIIKLENKYQTYNSRFTWLLLFWVFLVITTFTQCEF